MNALLVVVMAAITFNAPPTVGRFMRSNAFVRAIVGPIGSGKSSGCVVEMVRRAVEQEPDANGVRNTRFAVIRNTYRQLSDTTRKTFERWIPEIAGKWKEQEFSFTIKKRLKDGTRVNCEVLFRALDKPTDVGKVLSLELTGAYLNEGRELPKEIFDGIQGRVGRYPPKENEQGGATWFGVWMDSNAWATTSWCYETFNGELPEGFELFEQPDALGEQAENARNLPDGYYARLKHGKSQEWIDEYLRAKYPKADKGSIFGKWLAALQEQGLLQAFAHDVDEISTSWDLGISDNTSIWFWRINRDWMYRDFQEQLAAGIGSPEVHVAVDVVDHYSNSGESIGHYFGILRDRARERGYRYAKHYLPHDARQRSLQTGVSILDQFLQEKDFGPERTEIGAELDVANSIDAARWLLEQRVRIHPRCDEGAEDLRGGLKALRAYRFAWDEEKKTFSKTPVHDWASHSGDAFRELAGVVRSSEELTRPPMKPKSSKVPLNEPVETHFTEEEMLEPPEITFG